MTPHDDPLEALRARIEATQQAADRLVDELRAAGGPDLSTLGVTDPPPSATNGSPPADDEPPPRTTPAGRTAWPSGRTELEALIVALLEAIRSLVPPELQARMAELVRELLLALRALIDWYLERIDRQSAGAPPIEDIPID